MAATKITVRNDGSLRVEGDFEMVDQDGKVFGLGRTHKRRPLPLRPFRKQAFLRRRPQERSTSRAPFRPSIFLRSSRPAASPSTRL